MPKLKLISREFDAFAAAFQKHAETFCRAHPDVEIEHEYLEIHAHYDRMIGDAVAATDEYDLFLCVTDWMPEAMARGLLTPIDDYLATDPPDDYPHGWSPSMLGGQKSEPAPSEQGGDVHVYGLPFHDGPEMLLYRSDLFNSPEEQARFRMDYGTELRVPQTWSEFRQVAEFFTRPPEGEGEGENGEEGLWGACAASFPDGHNNVYDFLIHLWTRGGTLFDADWNPQFHGEIGQEALQYYVDLYRENPVISPRCLELDSIKCGFEFAKGTAAMMWNWAGFAAVTEVPEYSKIVGKTKCAGVPKGDGLDGSSTSLNIYWVLTIPAGSKNKDLAYQYMKFAASAEMDRQTSLVGANGTRLSTWRDPEVRAMVQYYEIIEDVHGNVQSPPAIPEYPEINEALSEMVDDVLHGRDTVPSALARAAERSREILIRSGRLQERQPQGEASI